MSAPDWLSELEARSVYEQRGAVVPDTAERAATLAQFRSLGSLVQTVLRLRALWPANFLQPQSPFEWKNIDMYGICDHIVKPLTARDRCSWVELVGRGAQPAVWFASHCWGTPFHATLQMLEWHAEVHQLSDASTWWCCTLANNQWDLAELGGTLDSTPFWRAIASAGCRGLVQLMDEQCTPHTRIWCILEMYVVFELQAQAEPKQFEVLAMISAGSQTWHAQDVPAGPALRLARGTERIKPEGGAFPHAVAEKGARVKVQEARASRDNDRKSILNTIVGRAGADKEPPAEHQLYERVNSKVRSLFRGPALWSHALKGEAGAVRELLAESTDQIDYRGVEGATPMHVAAWNGHVEVVRVLGAAGADLSRLNEVGGTPMLNAAQNGHAEVVRLLVELQADPSIAADQKLTPLAAAAARGHEAVVELLLGLKTPAASPVSAPEPQAITEEHFAGFVSLFAANECLIALGRALADRELERRGERYVQGVRRTELASWESCIKAFDAPGSRLWVLVHQHDSSSAVVGSVGVKIMQGAAELTRMYVDASCRGRGYGRLLVEHLLAHVRSLGDVIKEVCLSTPSVNTPAIGFYLRVGFKVARTFVVSGPDSTPLELSELRMPIATVQ